MTKCNKYEDCESCAFQDTGSPICDECDYGDQWEQIYEDSLDGKTVTFYTREELEKEAA